MDSKERTTFRAALADIWADLLAVEGVGEGDGFFKLGGDSLTATNLANEVNARLGAPVDFLAVFEFPTFGAYADFVLSLQEAQAVLPVEEGRL